MGMLFEDDPPVKYNNGYPAQPGTGPIGYYCKDCINITFKTNGKKKYYKCGLVMPTNGAGTDIRKSRPACRLFNKI